MSVDQHEATQLQKWVEPEITELNVNDTYALPRRGADVGGNPFVDCQFS